VKILSSGIITHFSNIVSAYQNRLFRLWIVAPWIGISDDRFDPLKRIINILASKRSDFNIITRPPENNWHKKAIENLQNLKNATVFTCPDLHTKLYLLECNGFKMAILGSPNLTTKANWENKELAVEFRTTKQDPQDPESAIIRDLIDYAANLRKDPNVSLEINS